MLRPPFKHGFRRRIRTPLPPPSGHGVGFISEFPGAFLLVAVVWMVNAPHFDGKLGLLHLHAACPLPAVDSAALHINITGGAGDYQVLLAGSAVALVLLEEISGLRTDVVFLVPGQRPFAGVPVRYEGVFNIRRGEVVIILNGQGLHQFQKGISVGLQLFIGNLAFLCESDECQHPIIAASGHDGLVTATDQAEPPIIKFPV